MRESAKDMHTLELRALSNGVGILLKRGMA